MNTNETKEQKHYHMMMWLVFYKPHSVQDRTLQVSGVAIVMAGFALTTMSLWPDSLFYKTLLWSQKPVISLWPHHTRNRSSTPKTTKCTFSVSVGSRRVGRVRAPVALTSSTHLFFPPSRRGGRGARRSSTVGARAFTAAHPRFLEPGRSVPALELHRLGARALPRSGFVLLRGHKKRI